MANYENLKSAIQQVVKTNGNNAITGALLQQSLLAMINSLGKYYQFAGIATPSTNPGTQDAKVFYIAAEPGTYTNFGGLEVTEDEVVALTWDSSWHLVPTGITKGRDGAPGPEGPQGPKGDKMTYADLTDSDKADLYEGGASLIRPLLDNKVDKEEGKGLSSNDYTDTEKAKLTELDMQINGKEARVIDDFSQLTLTNAAIINNWSTYGGATSWLIEVEPGTNISIDTTGATKTCFLSFLKTNDVVIGQAPNIINGFATLVTSLRT